MHNFDTLSLQYALPHHGAGFCVGALAALVLNILLPREADPAAVAAAATEMTVHKKGALPPATIASDMECQTVSPCCHPPCSNITN